jgi:protocatechuate 3,4-dioxygenase beta subunit
VVRADGLGPFLRSEIEIDPAAGDLYLGDTALFPEGLLRGRVVDGEGEPVAGAEIHGEMTSFPSIVRDLLDGERGQAPLAVTDARGEFSAGGFVPAEPLMVRAELDGATSEERLTLAAPEPVPVELVLIPPARIAGTVVDADGRPVAGASVAPSNMSTGQQSHFRWARADTDGRFEVTVAEPGRAILVANARGHARSEPVEIEVTGGQRVEDLTLALRRGHTLEGRVVDPAGRPIEGVELSASPGSEVVWTDADGRFAIEDRPAGTVVLNLRQEGHLSRELPVDLVPDGELVEVVLPTAEVTGTLRAADGTPAGGYKVQLTDRESEWWSSTAFQVTTAADGSFRFRGVADGTYLLRVFGPERDIYGWDGPEPVVVDGASVTGVVVTLPRPEEASR